MSTYHDEDFISLAGFMEELTQVDYYLEDQFQDQTIATQVKHVEIESPCQLDVVLDEEGKVSIGAIPPLYYLNTSFMPVFHAIKVTIDTTVNDEYEQ